MRAILALGVPVQMPNNKQDKKNKITRFLSSGIGYQDRRRVVARSR